MKDPLIDEIKCFNAWRKEKVAWCLSEVAPNVCATDHYHVEEFAKTLLVLNKPIRYRLHKQDELVSDMIIAEILFEDLEKKYS